MPIINVQNNETLFKQCKEELDELKRKNERLNNEKNELKLLNNQLENKVNIFYNFKITKFHMFIFKYILLKIANEFTN